MYSNSAAQSLCIRIVVAVVIKPLKESHTALRRPVSRKVFAFAKNYFVISFKILSLLLLLLLFLLLIFISYLFLHNSVPAAVVDVFTKGVRKKL